MKKIISLFICTCFLSCGGSTIMKSEEVVFPKNKKLSFTPTNVDFHFIRPLQLVITDSLLIIFDYFKRDDSFHIFNKETGNFIKSFGLVGKAGGEVISPTPLISTDNIEFYTSDRNGKKMVKYNIDSIIKGTQNFTDQYKFTDVEFPDIIDMFGDRFLVSDYKEGRFGLLNINSKSIQTIYSNYSNEIEIKKGEEWAIQQLFNNCAVIKQSPDKSKVVSMTYLGAIAETFDFMGDSLVPKATKCFVSPIIDIQKTWIQPILDKTIYGFGGAIVTNDYIYAIYNGYKAMEDKQNTIYVLDWNLNPVCKYDVDVDYLLCISQDNNTGDIYGVIKQDGVINIVKFDEKFIK